MKKINSKFNIVLFSIFLLSPSLLANDEILKSDSIPNDEKLVVVWTSGDKEVALKMVFLYTSNAIKRGWWQDVTLLIWGPSAKLLAEDEDLQKRLKKLDELGVHLLACKGCADMYEVSDKLTELGIKVKYTGTDLTNFIKERKVITF